MYAGAPYIYRPNTLTTFQSAEKVENLMNDKFVPQFTTITNPVPYFFSNSVAPSGISNSIPTSYPQLPASTVNTLQGSTFSAADVQNSVDQYASTIQQAGNNQTASQPFNNLYQVFDNPNNNALSFLGNTLSYTGGLFDSAIPGFSTTQLGEYIPSQSTNAGGYFYPVPDLQALYGNSYPQLASQNSNTSS